MLIHQYIPLCHIDSFLELGFRFSSCSAMTDPAEFRYGHVCNTSGVRSTDEIKREMDKTLSDGFINTLLKETTLSCWTKEVTSRACMWQAYGRGGPSIRVSVNPEAVTKMLWHLGLRAARGAVRYGPGRGAPISYASPEMIAPINRPMRDMDILGAFFYKMPTPDFILEDEYRFIVDSAQPFSILAHGLVRRVELSPLAPLCDEVAERLYREFQSRVHDAGLRASAGVVAGRV